MKKFEKIKFLIPLILGVTTLWSLFEIAGGKSSDKILMAVCLTILFCAWVKHWWRMARDEEYKKERIEWLALPLDQKGTGWWWSAKLNFFGALVLLIIFLILLFYQHLTLN